jgi:2'-5' RNA ligase
MPPIVASRGGDLARRQWLDACCEPSVTVPPQRFAIVLELDDLAAAAVRQLTERLDPERAAPVASVPPHVTLAAFGNLDVERFRPTFVEIAGRTSAVATTLASLGVFPTEEGVVFLAPTISRQLVELHLEMLARLQDVGAEVEPYWLPGQWVPHCTLAIGIPRERMSSALSLVYETLKPISASLTRLSLFDIATPRLLLRFGLSR